MNNITITVPEISCGHCKESIEGAVLALPGVSNATVDIEPKQVNLEFDESTVSLAQITAAIETAGYEVPEQS